MGLNERIDELWGKALDKAVPETYSSLTWTQVERIKVVFAELIVRECTNMVRESSLPDAYSEPCLQVIADDIMEHFGIEE